mmetsp:Transcript_13174/g.24313  ORF Transcript_13174/g.24313 Transcript_13174/m.24313 type:complete len:268 (+) Transcript_13174:121-924(+)
MQAVRPILKAKQELLKKLSEGDIDAFCFAERALQCDREVLLAAISVDGDLVTYGSASQKRDRDIILAAVSKNGEAIQHAAKELMSDRDLALVAVSQSGDALAHVAEEFTHDREIVLAAIAQSGWALAYAAEEFKNDKDIVLAAISSEPTALQAAAEVLLEDTAFAIEARQAVYFFRITTLSGRSCMVAADDEDDLELAYGVLSFLIIDVCAKLGLEPTGTETLVHGVDIVSRDTCIHDWPGSPTRGAVTDYQLIIKAKGSSRIQMPG